MKNKKTMFEESSKSEMVSLDETESKRKTAPTGEQLKERDAEVKVSDFTDGGEKKVYTSTSADSERNLLTLTETEDGKRLICNSPAFVAAFNREDDKEELFCMESGTHRVTVFQKGKKGEAKKSCKKTNSERGFSCSDSVEGVAYEYSAVENGVKENIVVREKREQYRYHFTLQCKNVVPVLNEKTKRIAFFSEETGEEVFYIPAPFMVDAVGTFSDAVTYQLKKLKNGKAHLTVIADSDYMNDEKRVFPVMIDPQIKLSDSSVLVPYHWCNGTMVSASQYPVGVTVLDDGTYVCNRMYLNLQMPVLPRNPRIKKAELIFKQAGGVCEDSSCSRFGLYHVEEAIVEGISTPEDDGVLIDYAVIIRFKANTDF